MLKEKIKSFVKNIITFPVFSSIEDKDALEEFLNKEIFEFYNHAPLQIKEFIENNRADDLIKSIYLKNIGIESEDLDTFLGVSLSMISKFFINKNSHESLKMIIDFLQNLGYEVSVYNIIWDGIQDNWILENVVNGEQVNPENFKIDRQEDILTPGHLVATKEYLENSSSTYTTPVVLITYNKSVSILDEFTPPSLLVAYALSKFGGDAVQLYTGSRTEEINIKDFLLVSRYMYLRWLQSRNENFDIGGMDKEYWYLVGDDSFVDEAYNLLSFLYNNVTTAQDFDQYVRQATQLLKHYTVYKGSGTVDDIHDYLYKHYSDLIDEIDASNLAVLIKNFNISFDVYIRTKLSSTQDNIDTRGILTLKYLFSIVYNSILAPDNSGIMKSLDVYKKYFLPIYTEFYVYADDAYKIKNMLMKFYVSDKWYVELSSNAAEPLVLKDKKLSSIDHIRTDYLLTKEYFYNTVLLRFSDSLTSVSDLILNIFTSISSIQKTEDSHGESIYLDRSDSADIKDYISSSAKTISESSFYETDKLIEMLYIHSRSALYLSDLSKCFHESFKLDKVNSKDFYSPWVLVNIFDNLESLDKFLSVVLINTYNIVNLKDQHAKRSATNKDDKINQLDYVVTTKT